MAVELEVLEELFVSVLVELDVPVELLLLLVLLLLLLDLLVLLVMVKLLDVELVLKPMARKSIEKPSKGS